MIYNRFKAQVALGNINLQNDEIRVALLLNTYTPDPDHDSFIDISTHETSGVGYTAGGQVLANQTVTLDDATDRMRFDGDDVVWASATITARYAVLYDVTLGGTNDLIALVDFGNDKSSDNGDFIIQWDTNGVIALS